ncbi:hypothetical protein [Serratia sp. DD3]|uniref:hypothetical protein n=1 Tax=Serratia sp. DD3 TaxID=1410619 RepID=UPI0004D6902A|nr:hypothetical protein [Serratia sp. DD3]KEY58406.1 hypothetical protein SRDD_26520 [Serratia sp. DD3]
MMSLPDYQGKLIAYLDHNILDIFVKNGLDKFGEYLARDFQVVYSDETLKEIKRSVGYEKQFLDVLNELKAFHLKILLDETYQSTGKATITNIDCHKAFHEYNTNDPIFDIVNDSMMIDIKKIFGGAKEKTFYDIKNEKIAAFEELLKVPEITFHEFPALASLFEIQANDMKEKFENASSELLKHFSKNIQNPIGWSGIKDFREHLGIGPIQLNNIEPPNVIQQIWNICRESLPHGVHMSLEDFFGIARNPIHPSSNYFNYQKVASIYIILNMLGYYPDSHIHKDRRFNSAISDQSHASMATFSDMLFSRDQYFIKKVEACYEFLGINTEIRYVE